MLDFDEGNEILVYAATKPGVDYELGVHEPGPGSTDQRLPIPE